jgi:hypothetical protein
VFMSLRSPTENENGTLYATGFQPVFHTSYYAGSSHPYPTFPVRTGDKGNKRTGDIGNSFHGRWDGTQRCKQGILRVQPDRDRSL